MLTYRLTCTPHRPRLPAVGAALRRGLTPLAAPEERAWTSMSTADRSQRGVGGGDLAGEAGVGRDQVAVDAERVATALLVQVRQHERRHGLSFDVAAAGLRHARLDEWLDVEALRRRLGEEEPRAAELPMGGGDACRFDGGVDTRPQRRSAFGGVEARQRVRAPADYGH